MINDDTAVFTNPPRKDAAKSIREREDIVAYRSSSCVELSCPNVALIVGVEICSGIIDSMIDQVISHRAQVTSVADLIEFSIPAYHAGSILSIITSHTQQDNRI